MKKRPTAAEYKTTYRHRAIMDFIVDYKARNDGIAPTMREIGAATGTASTSAVRYRLERLEKCGRLVLAGGYRNIRVVGAAWLPPRDDGMVIQNEFF